MKSIWFFIEYSRHGPCSTHTTLLYTSNFHNMFFMSFDSNILVLYSFICLLPLGLFGAQFSAIPNLRTRWVAFWNLTNITGPDLHQSCKFMCLQTLTQHPMPSGISSKPRLPMAHWMTVMGLRFFFGFEFRSQKTMLERSWRTSLRISKRCGSLFLVDNGWYTCTVKKHWRLYPIAGWNNQPWKIRVDSVTRRQETTSGLDGRKPFSVMLMMLPHPLSVVNMELLMSLCYTLLNKKTEVESEEAFNHPWSSMIHVLNLCFF